MNRTITFQVASVLCLWSLLTSTVPEVLGQVSSQQTDGPLRRLQSSTTQWSDASVSDLRSELDLWLSDPVHRSKDWTALLAIANDTSRPVVLRVAVWSSLVERSDPDHADGVLREVGECLTKVESAIADPLHRSAQVLEFDMLRAFLPEMPQVKSRWLAVYGQRPGVEDLLRRAYCLGLYNGCGAGMAQSGTVDIVDLAGSLSQDRRTRFAEGTLHSMSTTWTVDTRIADWVSTPGLAELRTSLASSTLSKPESLPVSFAFVLAHRGDQQTKVILERVISDLDNLKEVVSESWRKEVRSHFTGYIRMVQAQGTSTGLSAIIADRSDLSGADTWIRAWAMFKASQGGYDKGILREAFLEYAHAVLESAPKPPRASLQVPRVGALRDLRDRARELGILGASDLSDIPLPLQR